MHLGMDRVAAMRKKCELKVGGSSISPISRDVYKASSSSCLEAMFVFNIRNFSDETLRNKILEQIDCVESKTFYRIKSI